MTRWPEGYPCLINLDENPNNDRLILKIHPDALLGINGLTDEEIGDMLCEKVNDLAGALANPEKFDATLVKGTIVSGCAIGVDEAALAGLTDIYTDVVAGAGEPNR